MRKWRYEILVPTAHIDGRLVDERLFELIQEALVTRMECKFRSTDPSRIWLHESARRIFVDLDEVSDHHEFFSQFKTAVADRFEQVEIQVTSYQIEIL